jgi:hypothetical protein
MYSTCIFCHSSLGSNEAIENFPVGRRLAFDSGKGRLWAVCTKCGRWNLTPIEERWEAIEECEREYRVTRKRASTDEIGLGRLNEGTDLIRIGKPLRPEFAAWRYGPSIRRRANSALIGAGIGVAAFAGMFFGGGVLIGSLVGTGPAMAFGFLRHREVRAGRRYLRMRASMIAGRRIIDDKQIDIRIVPSDDEQGWALRFFGFTMPVDLTGRDALGTVHKVMPAINVLGGFRSSVKKAVSEIEEVPAPELYFKRVMDYARVNRRSYDPIQAFPAEMRLAVEMAAHEETERRAIVEGELARLAEDWREAEEIASIADDLFLPESVTEDLERMKEAAQNPR